MPKIITFGTLKGGTGKTNTCFNITGFLAKEKKKILVIDLDPQANITNDLGFDETLDEFDYVGDIFEKGVLPIHVIIEAPNEAMPTVDLIPSSVQLTTVEMKIITRPAREHILKKYINKYKDFFNKYDYILIDTSPNVSAVNQNGFVASDSILLISDVGINSIKGAKVLINVWEDICEALDIEFNIKGLVINRYDSRIKLAKDFIEYVQENPILKEYSFDTIIPENVKLKETELEKLPISYYDTKCSGFKAYTALVQELKNEGVL